MLTIPTTTKARNAANLSTSYDFSRPLLTIVKGREADFYTVTEFVPGMDGRAFKLTKNTGEGYSCFVARNQQDCLCECRGFEAKGYCKHLDTLKVMLAAGDLDEADRPESPYPSPEQLAEEAGVCLPF